MRRLPCRWSPNHVGWQLTAVHRHPTRLRRRVSATVTATTGDRRRVSLPGSSAARVPHLVLGRGEAVVGGIVERGADDIDGTGGDKGTGDEAADDLALGAGEGDGEGAVGEGGGGGVGVGEEGGGDGEDVEAAVEGDGGAVGSGGLAEGDVGDGAGAGEDAEAHVLPPAEPGDGLDDVVSSGDFEDVGAHGGLGVAGDDDGGLGLVLGPRGPPPGPPDHLDGRAVSSAASWAGRVWVVGLVGGGGDGLGSGIVGRGGGGGGGGVVSLLGGLAFAGSHLEGIDKRVKLVVVVVVVVLLLLVLVLELREHIVMSFILCF
ncbi:hypothetical protein TIFTF001_009344 [Ficus carica]|uniref:Uncharacterized protein n=1 Tax=Ficus carica TaxID=3494 RepID=A0AA88D3I9_FICCA|nr:hypothetical protein TIFTF001_009344 [Ficus carica]